MLHYNDQHDFKACGENQRIMLHDKSWFLTLTPLSKNGSRVPARVHFTDIIIAAVQSIKHNY